MAIYCVFCHNNAKNWQFSVYFVVIYAFFRCKFYSPKIFASVKKMTNMRYDSQSHFWKNTNVWRAWKSIQMLPAYNNTFFSRLQIIRYNISEMMMLLLSKYQVCIVDIPIFNTKRFSTILWVVRKVSRIRFAQIKWTFSRSK